MFRRIVLKSVKTLEKIFYSFNISYFCIFVYLFHALT